MSGLRLVSDDELHVLLSRSALQHDTCVASIGSLTKLLSDIEREHDELEAELQRRASVVLPAEPPYPCQHVWRFPVSLVNQLQGFDEECVYCRAGRSSAKP